MRAIVQDRYGGTEVLRVADVRAPTPGPGEVLLDVQAASLHPDVWHVMTGRPYLLRLMGSGIRRPRQPVPGTDVAGVVAALGDGVTRFAVGDAVYGETLTGHQWKNAGAFAEQAVAQERRLEWRPEQLTPVQAASVPTSGAIAVQVVRDEGRVRAGQRVLVHGAAGGVGHLAVQLAVAYGAHVTASDLPGKTAMLTSLGAQEVVEQIPADARFDVVVDVPGDRLFTQWREQLEPGGRYVLVGHDHYGKSGGRVLGGVPTALALVARSLVRKELSGFRDAKDPGDRLVELTRLAAAGQLRPMVDRTFPLEDVAAAMAHLASGRGCGKVVLTV